MNALDRIIGFLGGLFVLVGGIALLVLASPYQGILEYYWTSILNITGSLEIILAGILVLLISIRILWISIKRDKKSSSVTKQMELGELKISLDAIETMVKQVAEQTRGVRDVKTKIKAAEDGVIIYFKGKVLPDVIIPEITEELQQDIKSHIETASGILVKGVKVLVENISDEKSKSVNVKRSARIQSSSKEEDEILEGGAIKDEHVADEDKGETKDTYEEKDSENKF